MAYDINNQAFRQWLNSKGYQYHEGDPDGRGWQVNSGWGSYGADAMGEGPWTFLRDAGGEGGSEDTALRSLFQDYTANRLSEGGKYNIRPLHESQGVLNNFGAVDQRTIDWATGERGYSGFTDPKSYLQWLYGGKGEFAVDPESGLDYFRVGKDVQQVNKDVVFDPPKTWKDYMWMAPLMLAGVGLATAPAAAGAGATTAGAGATGAGVGTGAAAAGAGTGAGLSAGTFSGIGAGLELGAGTAAATGAGTAAGTAALAPGTFAGIGAGLELGAAGTLAGAGAAAGIAAGEAALAPGTFEAIGAGLEFTPTFELGAVGAAAPEAALSDFSYLDQYYQPSTEAFDPLVDPVSGAGFDAVPAEMGGVASGGAMTAVDAPIGSANDWSYLDQYGTPSSEMTVDPMADPVSGAPMDSIPTEMGGVASGGAMATTVPETSLTDKIIQYAKDAVTDPARVASNVGQQIVDQVKSDPWGAAKTALTIGGLTAAAGPALGFGNEKGNQPTTPPGLGTNVEPPGKKPLPLPSPNEPQRQAEPVVIAPWGVNYLKAIKNRDTGKDEYSMMSKQDADRRGRSVGWGNLFTY